MTNRLASLLVVSLLARGVAAHATTIDGQRDPEYGPALGTQTTQTSLGDTPPGYNPFSPLTMAIGSELDGAHGFVSGSTLYLFSDGAYEIVTVDDQRWELLNLVPVRLEPTVPGTTEPDRVYQAVKQAAARGPLEDDFSLMALTFS